MYNDKNIKDMMQTSGYSCWVLRMRNTKHSPARPIFKYEPRDKKADHVNMDESIHTLETQLEIYGGNPEVVFEILLKDIKSSTENNGDVIGPVEFQCQATAAPAVLAGTVPQTNGPGFATYEAYLDAKLALSEERAELRIERNNFLSEKQRFEEKMADLREALKDDEKKFKSHVAAGEEALDSYIPKLIKLITGKDIEQGLSGAEVKEEPRTPLEQVIDSISENLYENIADIPTATNMGVIVHRFITQPELRGDYFRIGMEAGIRAPQGSADEEEEAA